MLKQYGFTLIETMVAIAIIGLIGIILVGAVTGASTNDSVSFGYNGLVETRCINGYQFVISNRDTRQVMDEQGHGVKCESK